MAAVRYLGFVVNVVIFQQGIHVHFHGPNIVLHFFMLTSFLVFEIRAISAFWLYTKGSRQFGGCACVCDE